MKPTKLSKRLAVVRTTIRPLTPKRLEAVRGGCEEYADDAGFWPNSFFVCRPQPNDNGCGDTYSK
jgi:hypothetical protein